MAGNSRWQDPVHAWAPFEPCPEQPWDLRMVGHLFRRAAFGGNWEALQKALADGVQLTVDKLVRGSPDTAEFNRIHEGYEQRATQGSGGFGPQAWWLRRICETPHPLLEQMTLFWHSHFGISNIHVGIPSLVCRHVHSLREHALGSLDELLAGVLDQPALFMCANARANPRGKPNENVPHVLFEQFSLLGDVKAAELRDAARALTGWFVSNNELRYSAREHDAGPKSFLGRAGELEKKDLVTALAENRGTANCVVRKLYRWLICEAASPSQELIAPLVNEFAQKRDITRLVSTMLRSNIFFSPAAYGQRIKSPVEFAMSVIRPLDGAISTTRLAADLAELGQDLYAPPTIHGWAGHRNWINRFTMIERLKLSQALFASSGPYAGKLDPSRAAARANRLAPDSGGAFLRDLFLQGAVANVAKLAAANRESDGKDVEQCRRQAARIVALPEFNLA